MQPTSFNCLHLPRLLLREMTPDMWRSVHQTFSEEELIHFFGIQNDKELAEERKRFAEGLTGYRRSFIHFHLIEKASEKVIGACGFHAWHVPHRRAEVGYAMMDESRKRHGFMREAFPAIVRYGFEKMNLNRIEAFIGRQNEPSLKLVHGLGFVEEGVMRAHYCKDGHIEDSVVFSLLRDEWMAGAAR